MREAGAWFRERNVSRETLGMLERYVALLVEENERQNLIGPKTVEAVWNRHVLDSAQLLDLAPLEWRSWLDIGSGGGLPGLVVAILSGKSVTLVEPRNKRAEFLRRVGRALALPIEVVAARVEALRDRQFDVVSARAVAALPELFAMTAHLSGADTVHIYPKGRRGEEELELARQEWQGALALSASITDPESVIVVARGVRRRGR